MITIRNLKTPTIIAGTINLYCGRQSSWHWAQRKVKDLIDCSCLGNPHNVYQESQRDWSCDKFEQESFPALLKVPYVLKILNRIRYLHQHGKYIQLWCWCAPLRCHTETIKKWCEQ